MPTSRGNFEGIYCLKIDNISSRLLYPTVKVLTIGYKFNSSVILSNLSFELNTPQKQTVNLKKGNNMQQIDNFSISDSLFSHKCIKQRKTK